MSDSEGPRILPIINFIASPGGKINSPRRCSSPRIGSRVTVRGTPYKESGSPLKEHNSPSRSSRSPRNSPRFSSSPLAAGDNVEILQLQNTSLLVSDNCPVDVERALILTSHIGFGSFGVVQRGQQGQQNVAVKRYNRHVISNKMRQMDGERLVLGLAHPNIVRLYACSSGDYEPGIVIMELCETTLSKRLSLSRFITRRKRLLWSLHIARALEYLHASSLVHGDVKPLNVLLSFDGKCKLGDFGTCSKFDDKDPVCGLTIPYAAPECFSNASPHFTADIYSLGMTFWKMLSLEDPYPNLNSHIIIYKVVKLHERPPLRGADVEFEKLISNCWHHLLEQRPSAQRVVGKLCQLNERQDNWDD